MAPTVDAVIEAPSRTPATTNKEFCCELPIRDGHRPPRATIMSLPPELLVMIFEYFNAPLIEDCERIRDVQNATRNIPSNHERITRGNVFPYPYVDVCKHWATVILGVPRFWTNAVVFIGPREKVYGNFIGGEETIFGASQTLPFDVTIRSTKLDPRLDPDGRGGSANEQDLRREQADIVRILGLLAPHIHRCRSLSLYTLLAGAMPLVYRHLESPAPLLKVLTFHTDNILYWDPAGDHDLRICLPFDTTPVETTTFAPPLEKLTVDGYSFSEMHAHHAQIAEKYGTDLIALALVNYFPGWEQHFKQPFLASTMARSLESLTHLYSLKLSSVCFDDDDSDDDALALPELNICALFLENIHDDSLNQLFLRVHFPEVQDLWFKGCWPGGYDYTPADLPTDVTFLTLEGVNDADLAPAICDWGMYAIRVCMSLAFDDTVLKMLSAPRDPEIAEADITQTTEFGCDALRMLLFIVVPGITTAALKRMVISRNRWIDYTDPKWRTNTPVGPAIMEIKLWQMPGQMEFTKEDEAWFQERVADFQFEWVVDTPPVHDHRDTELYFSSKQ